MKKHTLLTGCLVTLFLVGCAGRDPMTFRGQYETIPLTNVKAAITNAAFVSGWTICEVSDHQLRADLTYKKWTIFADIDYTQNQYSIKPNLKYTTLANKDGTVHRAVNNLIKRLDQQVAYNVYYAPQDKVSAPKLNQCVDYDSMHYDKTGILFASRGYVNSGFAWADQPVSLPENTKFSYVVKQTRGIPQELTDSMQRRFAEYLADRDWLGFDATYRIEVTLVAASEHSKGGAMDFMSLADSHRQLQTKAIVKDRNGKPICFVDTSVRVDTKGWTGIINKSTNKVTADIVSNILAVLDQKLFAKNKS